MKAKFSCVALRNANKPHAACAAFAQALYHIRKKSPFQIWW
jgi:hypothetical protein